MSGPYGCQYATIVDTPDGTRTFVGRHVLKVTDGRLEVHTTYAECPPLLVAAFPRGGWDHVELRVFSMTWAPELGGLENAQVQLDSTSVTVSRMI